jgi:single-strand DNA-binding protein
MSVNKAILIGRLGKDPEYRSLDSGASVASFSIATSEKWKDQTTGEKKEVTDWHNIVVWRGLADIAQKYLHKGDLVYIEGKIKTRMWEKGGIKRYTTEIVADNLTMLGSKGSGSNNSSTPSGYDQHSGGGSNVNNSHSQTSDDLPF